MEGICDEPFIVTGRPVRSGGGMAGAPGKAGGGTSGAIAWSQMNQVAVTVAERVFVFRLGYSFPPKHLPLVPRHLEQAFQQRGNRDEMDEEDSDASEEEEGSSMEEEGSPRKGAKASESQVITTPLFPPTYQWPFTTSVIDLKTEQKQFLSDATTSMLVKPRRRRIKHLPASPGEVEQPAYYCLPPLHYFPPWPRLLEDVAYHTYSREPAFTQAVWSPFGACQQAQCLLLTLTTNYQVDLWYEASLDSWRHLQDLSMVLLQSAGITPEQYTANNALLQSLQTSTMAWSNHYSKHRSLIALGSRAGDLYLFFFENDTLQAIPCGHLSHARFFANNAFTGGVSHVAFSSLWQQQQHQGAFIYVTTMVTALTDGGIYLWNVTIAGNEVRLALRETVMKPDEVPVSALYYAQPVGGAPVLYAAKLGRLIFRDQTGTSHAAIDASSTVVNMHVSMNGHQARCYYGSGLVAEVNVSGGFSVTYHKSNANQWDQYTKTQMDGDSKEDVALLPSARTADEEQEGEEEGLSSTGGRYDFLFDFPCMIPYMALMKTISEGVPQTIVTSKLEWRRKTPLFASSHLGTQESRQHTLVQRAQDAYDLILGIIRNEEGSPIHSMVWPVVEAINGMAQYATDQAIVMLQMVCKLFSEFDWPSLGASWVSFVRYDPAVQLARFAANLRYHLIPMPSYDLSVLDKVPSPDLLILPCFIANARARFDAVLRGQPCAFLEIKVAQLWCDVLSYKAARFLQQNKQSAPVFVKAAVETARDLQLWLLTHRKALFEGIAPLSEQSALLQELQLPPWASEEDYQKEMALFERDTPQQIQQRATLVLQGELDALTPLWPARELCSACDAPLFFGHARDAVCSACQALHQRSAHLYITLATDQVRQCDGCDRRLPLVPTALPCFSTSSEPSLIVSTLATLPTCLHCGGAFHRLF